MTTDERQWTALAGTVGWLEDELRETRALTAKLQQALEQSQAQVWELNNRLIRTEDAIAAVPPLLKPIPELETQLRQLKDLFARVHEQELATASRVGEVARQADAAAERERQALNDLVHRLDTVERQGSGTAARFDALDDSGRRSMESVTLLRQRLEEVGRAVDLLETRLGRQVESAGRADHEFSRLNGEIDGLRRQDELIAERVQAYTEMLKRLEGQITLVAADVAVKQDVLEQIGLNRVETHRLEERLAGLDAAVDALRDRDDELSRQVALLDGRQKGFQERLTGLLGDIATYRTQVNEQFQRLHQLQERLTRRQLEELERELRELRVYAFRPQEGER